MAEKLIDSWLGWFPDIEGDRECKVIEDNGQVEFAVLDREDDEWIYDGDANHLLLNRFKENKAQIQTLETRVDELERALAGVRELMGEEHTYWACYPAQGPHNAVLRDYTKAWCKLIDRLIEGETFEEFTLTDEVDKYFKKEQQQ